MKIAAASIILFLLTACHNGKPPGSPEMNREFEVKYHEMAFINEGKITIRFSSVIQDSRCPIGVQCIQAGEAEIELQLSKGRMAPTTSKLSTVSGSNETTFENTESS